MDPWLANIAQSCRYGEIGSRLAGVDAIHLSADGRVGRLAPCDTAELPDTKLKDPTSITGDLSWVAGLREGPV